MKYIFLFLMCFALAEAKITPHTNNTIVLSKTESSVTGVGTTYNAAYQQAKALLPAGKRHIRVSTNKTDNKFYVTLYYND